MRDQAGSWRSGRFARAPLSVVGLVMIACTVVFGVQLAMGWQGFGAAPDLPRLGSVSWPRLREGEWWRLFTYAFAHGNPLHLLMNLIGLFIFGRLAWQEFGNRHWLGIFLVGTVAGALGYLSVFHAKNELLGASAGVYAVLAAATLRMPDLPLSFPFLPGLSLRLRNFTLGVLLFDLINCLAQVVALNNPGTSAVSATQVASLAHLGGALAGFLYVRLLTDGFDSMVRESERRERLWREQQQQQQQRRRREPRHVVAGKVGAPPPEEIIESTARPADFMEDQVNPILEKLHAHGAASLSPEERRILDEAARRLRQSA